MGFEAIRVGEVRWNAFDGAPSESSAAEFGTVGVAFAAGKPRSRNDAVPGTERRV
ncbi:MAG TPA: hypothetical protein VG370_27315 [Chloroflexota bacterium]|nr:hypothetical protein [Chloroflexota bacterium]